MIAGIQEALNTCWQRSQEYLESSGLRAVIDKVQSVIKTIFETILTACLFYLNPYVFPLALFIGMTQIAQIELPIEKITAIWNCCWPLICLAAAPLIYLACTKTGNRLITAALTLAGMVCAAQWGSRIAEWIKTRQTTTNPSPATA
jgi:hypothetical protein